MRSRIIILLALSGLSFSARAHTHIQETQPAKETTVKANPENVVIKFSESLETAMSKIEVKNSKTGEIVSEKTMPGSDDSTLQVHLKNIKNEKVKYVVSWKAVSKDSHTMKGTYSFTIDPIAK